VSPFCGVYKKKFLSMKGNSMKKLKATGGGGQQRPPTEQKTSVPTKKKSK